MEANMKKFEPWKRQKRKALIGFVVALGTFALGFSMLQTHADEPWVPIAVMVVGAVIMARSASLLKSAQSREFGKVFEEEQIRNAKAYLNKNGIETKKNYMMRYGGDIDLVAFVGDTRVPVEVKSFRVWRQFWIFAGQREQKAMAQSERQRKAIGAPAGIIWLPQGRASFPFFNGKRGVKVVFGNERTLTRTIKRLR